MPIAIIAALEREIAPLIRGWRAQERLFGARIFHFYESPTAVAVAGGIGTAPAAAAARAAIEFYAPSLVLSVGLAGALVPQLPAGEAAFISSVISSETGQSFPCTVPGKWSLVTGPLAATPESKRALAARSHAQVADMEASAVAAVAQSANVPFAAAKAVSDDLSFALPPLARFIRADGAFATGSFAAYIALRPWCWGSAIRLGKKSGLAVANLTLLLQQFISQQHSASTSPESSISTIKSMRS